MVGHWPEDTTEAKREFVAHTEGWTMAHMLFPRNGRFRSTRKYLEKRHLKRTEQSGKTADFISKREELRIINVIVISFLDNNTSKLF